MPHTPSGRHRGLLGVPGHDRDRQRPGSSSSGYRDAAANAVPVIPDVAPGFNDRGFRLRHRPPGPTAPVDPGAGPPPPWTTSSAVSPCPSRPETADDHGDLVERLERGHGHRAHSRGPHRRDDSPSGDAYTQGYEYGGEGQSAVARAPAGRGTARYLLDTSPRSARADGSGALLAAAG